MTQPLPFFHRVYRRLENTSWFVLLIEGLVAVSLIGVLNYLTTWEMNLSVLYLFVVGALAYHSGLVPGLIVAVASAICWTLADNLTGIPYTRWYMPFWTGLVRLLTLITIALGLSFLKKQMQRVERMARFDILTGALTRTFFHELAEIELRRATRYHHPFTIAYIDLDCFKEVNDRFGHDAGDNLLRLVANTTRQNIRSSDCVARMGGDEFVVLLVETNEASARSCLEKLRERLRQAMEPNHGHVTFSIGAVTYESPPASIEEMVGLADTLMYKVKQRGKNDIEHITYRKNQG